MKPMHLVLLPVLAVLASAARADLVIGKVVGPTGAGIPSVNLDFIDLITGDRVAAANDSTDSQGDFAATVAGGIYEVVFLPPGPPVTTFLVGSVEPVIVSGTTNMGTIVLQEGAALSGTAVNFLGQPVANVDVDVVDLAVGEKIPLSGDSTDAFGKFVVAVPKNDIEVQLDTTNVFGQTLVSVELALTITGDTDIGTVTLAQGFVVNGHVQKSTGAPVVNADMDAENAVTGADVYTPNDNTDSNGNFSLVVPAGTLDFEACPKFSDLLTTGLQKNVVVSGGMTLPTFVLQPGVVLSGNVMAFDGSTFQGADIDLDVPGTGADVPICGDKTDASGDYAIVVPTGTFDVTFEPPGFALPLGADVHGSVTVSGSTSLDGVLPSCPFSTNYGAGLAGSGGFVPHLTSSGGAPRVGNPSYAMELQDGLGGAPAIFGVSLGSASTPAFGGTIWINLSLVLAQFNFVLGGTPGQPGAGDFTFPLPVPITPALVGITVFTQFGVVDSSAAQGLAMSEGMTITFCD